MEVKKPVKEIKTVKSSKENFKISELMKKDKFRGIVIAIGILGVALIYLSSLFTGKESKEKQQIQPESVITAREYESQLEERLAKIVSAITGEENPVVMVTLSNLGEYVYAENGNEKLNQSEKFEQGEKTQDDRTQENSSEYVIIKDSQGNQQTVSVSEIQPEVKGVVIVSKYSNDVFTEEKIIMAVKTATNLSSAKICVVSAK